MKTAILVAILFLVLFGRVAAAPCVFPASATTGSGDYFAGPSAQAVAATYLTTSPKAMRWMAPDRPFTVLQMMPPSVWKVRYRDALANAIHKRFPNGEYGIDPPDDARELWLAEVRGLPGNPAWIASILFINAPSLGGLLQYGPTGCDFVSASSAQPGKPITISGGIFNYRGTYTADDGSKGTMALIFGPAAPGAAGSYWFNPFGRAQTVHDLGGIYDVNNGSNGLSFTMREDRGGGCAYEAQAVPNADGKIRGSYKAINGCGPNGTFILDRNDIP